LEAEWESFGKEEANFSGKVGVFQQNPPYALTRMAAARKERAGAREDACPLGSREWRMRGRGWQGAEGEVQSPKSKV